MGRRRGSEDRTYPSHLPVIRGRINRDVSRLGEGRKAGEAEESKTDHANFRKGIRADAYCDHDLYKYHKHDPCRLEPKVALATQSNPPDFYAR